MYEQRRLSEVGRPAPKRIHDHTRFEFGVPLLVAVRSLIATATNAWVLPVDTDSSGRGPVMDGSADDMAEPIRDSRR